jgi:hypothetical protein
MWRRVVAVSAAVLIAGGSAAAVSRALDPPAPRPAAPALPWAAVVHGGDWRTGAAATVRYLPRPWGLQLQVQVSGIPPGTLCALKVVSPGGREIAGGWTVAAGHTGAWYPASAPLPVSGGQHLGQLLHLDDVQAAGGQGVGHLQADVPGTHDRRGGRCGFLERRSAVTGA